MKSSNTCNQNVKVLKDVELLQVEGLVNISCANPQQIRYVTTGTPSPTRKNYIYCTTKSKIHLSFRNPILKLKQFIITFYVIDKRTNTYSVEYRMQGEHFYRPLFSNRCVTNDQGSDSFGITEEGITDIRIYGFNSQNQNLHPTFMKLIGDVAMENPEDRLVNLLRSPELCRISGCSSQNFDTVLLNRRDIVDGPYIYSTPGNYITVLFSQPIRSPVFGSEIVFYQKDGRNYTYTMEISEDGKVFIPIFENKTVYCRDFVYFRSPKPIKMIRMTGYNSQNANLHLISFGFFGSFPKKFRTFPRTNLISNRLLTNVVCENPGNLQTVCTSTPKDDTYIYGSPDKPIVVELKNKMKGGTRIFGEIDLYKKDGRTYFYTLEVSTDGKNWESVFVDRKVMDHDVFDISSNYVMFLRFSGSNTQNKNFHPTGFKIYGDVDL